MGAALIAIAFVWIVGTLIFFALITDGRMKLHYITSSGPIFGAVVITFYIVELFAGVASLISGFLTKKA